MTPIVQLLIWLLVAIGLCHVFGWWSELIAVARNLDRKDGQ